MMDASDDGWNIATPHIEFILDRLGNYEKYNRTIILSMEYNFIRKVNFINLIINEFSCLSKPPKQIIVFSTLYSRKEIYKTTEL